MTLAELRALLAKATPGPWDAKMGSTISAPSAVVFYEVARHEDQELVCAAVNALPALLNIAEAAEAWMDARVDDNFSSVRLLEAIKKMHAGSKEPTR